jgi:hypothetical protein
MEKEELIKVIAKYIAWNWQASLGYGNDEDIITRACDDLNWLLNPAGITTKDIISTITQDNK